MTPFEIIGNGISLDVAQSSKLTTEFVAATFNDSAVFAGSYSYPISFPLTAKNIAFFEHSHHLENRSARKSRAVTIVLFGMSWKNAKLTYSIKGNSYEGVLTVDNGAIADAMRDVKLGDVFTSNNDGKITFKSLPLGNTVAEVTDNMLLGNTPNNNKGYCWPVVVNTLIMGKEAEGIDVSLANENTIINDFNSMRSVDPTKFYCPMLYLKWVAGELCKYLGYSMTGDFWEDDFIKSLIIYNNGLRTGEDWVINQRKINIAQHLPEMTVSELFKGLRNDFRVMIYFDSMTGIAHFKKSDLALGSNERVDLRKNIHYGTLEIQPLSDSAFKLLTKTDDNDELYSSVLYEKSLMLGYDLKTWKEIQLTFGKVFMQTSTYKSVPNVTTPYAMQTCNIYSKSYEENETVYNGGNAYNLNPFTPRLLSYKGVVKISETVRIPFATSDKRGPLGMQYTSTLEQGGTGGILDSFSLSFYRYLCLSEKVDFKTEISIPQFFNINPLNKILISDINQASTEALLDKVVFEPRAVGNGITAKVTCYPNYMGLGDAQNLKIIVGSAEIENENGTIYAKLFVKVTNYEQNPNNPRLYKRYCDVWLEFFSDPYAGIPRLVENLEMYQKIVRTDYGNFNDVKSITEEPIRANGIRLDLGERIWAESYLVGSTLKTDKISYFIKNKEMQPTVIGHYEMVNPSNGWSKYEDKWSKFDDVI